MTFEQLHSVLASVSDRRLSPNHLVYELRPGRLPFTRRSRSLPRRQRRALSALREVGWPLFAAIDADPRELGLAGTWVQAAARTWLVPPEGATQALLERWLHDASYQLYLAREPVDAAALPDLFRRPLSDAVAWVEGHALAALLDSLHDEREWRILVQPGVVPTALAA